MSRYQKPAPLNLNADDVWAAACMAQRLNQGYIKVSEDAPSGQKNRSLVEHYLADTSKITDEDREEGKLVRKFYQAYTFKSLKVSSCLILTTPQCYLLIVKLLIPGLILR